MPENVKDDRPSAGAGGPLPERCPCPKVECERHGKCPECIAYHGRKGKLPRCKR